jgi:hypothetical protein
VLVRRLLNDGRMDAYRDDRGDLESPELQWFDRATFTPIPPPPEPASLPDGIFGDRVWRARGWATED